MPKAVAVIQGCYVGLNGALFVSYGVSVNLQNNSGVEFSSNAPAGELAGLTLAQWKVAAQDKVVADCASRNITLVRADVNILGGPL